MQLIFNFPNRGQRSKSTHRRGAVGVKRHEQHRKKKRDLLKMANMLIQKFMKDSHSNPYSAGSQHT